MKMIIGLVLIFLGAFIAAGARGLSMRLFRSTEFKYDITIRLIGLALVILGALFVFMII